MARKSKKHREPTPEEEGAQVLEAAAKAGADYAHEQVNGDYFRDWVYEQVAEAERMRRQDPGSVFPSDTPDGAKRAAKNMLQQLEWDTERQMDAREILELSGASGVFGAGSADWVRDTYGITQGDVTGAFFSAFREALRAPAVRQWLTDLVLETNEQVGGVPKGELAQDARRHVSRERGGDIDWDDGPASQGQWFGRVHGRDTYVITKNVSDEARRATGLSWGGYDLARVTPTGDQHVGYFQSRAIAQSQASSDLVAQRTHRVDPQTWAEPRRSEMRDSSEVPTERQILDFFIFDAEDADLGTFSRAKTDEVAAHFRVDPAAMFRALDALAERGVLKKTRDLMKRHRGKTAFGYQWWEYNWTKADLARWEDREQEKLSERRTVRDDAHIRWEPSGGGTGWRGIGAAGYDNAYLLRRAGGGKWNLHIMGRKYGPFDSLDAGKVEAEKHERLGINERQPHRVRDYVPTDSRGRPLSPPTKDYEKAKREADRMGGVVKFKVGRPGAREPSLHGVRDFDSLASLVEHARDQGGATHVIVLGKHASLFYPSGRYWPSGEPQYEAGKVWQKGGYWHTVAPSHRTALSGGLPGGTEPIEAYLAGKGARVVRDYVPTDTRGRPVSGPTKDYEKAKRDAARAGGVVKFLPGRKPVREVPRSGRVASSRRPQRRRPVPR